jgi:ADP-heptose:LPS heptosyltransferase
MQVDTLRILDRFIGVPLCFVCTLARRLAHAVTGAPKLPVPRKILIIKLSEMGSTVLAYPALVELKRRCPDAEFYFLVFAKNAAIVEILQLVSQDHLITVDYRTVGHLLISGVRALKRLWDEAIDTTIDMDLFSRLTALLAFLFCRGNRVGFYRYKDEGIYRGDLLTHRVLYSAHVHTSAAFMALIRTLFVDHRDEPHYRARIESDDLTLLKHSPTLADIASVRQKLLAAGVKTEENEPLILINPNSSDIFPLRKWPLKNYAELCRRLLHSLPHGQLIITGVASEGEDARYILEYVQSPRCVNFTGKTTFRELLALYSIASLMVTNDSGPAHFASLLDLPTAVLFGPETPNLYRPLGDKHRAFYSHFACSPCVSVYNNKKSSCQDNRCLKAITVDEVLAEILPWVDTRALHQVNA